MKRILAAVLLAIPIAGCSQTMQTQFAYIDRVIKVEMPDDTYRIREHPRGDRLMVTPSWGTIVRVGTQRGWTLGMVGRLPSAEASEAAARRHMDMTGRTHCVVLSSGPLMDPHYEVIFDCTVRNTLQ